MMREARRAGIVLGMLAGLSLGGCATEGDEERAPAPKESPAPESPAPRAQAPEPEAPLGDYEAVRGGTLELKPPLTWKRSSLGAFEVMTSPNGRARILTAPLEAGEEAGKKRDQALAALEASEVRTAEERAIRMGEGQLDAKASDGSFRLPSGEAGFQYAVIASARGKRMFFLYAFDKDASEATRASGMRVIASLREKI